MKPVIVIYFLVFSMLIYCLNQRELGEYPDITFGKLVEYALTLLKGEILTANQGIFSKFLHMYAYMPWSGVFSTNGFDSKLNISDLVNSEGFEFEEYYIKTKDDYILNLWRIKKNGDMQKENPVILHHGLLGSSFNWIANGKNESLAYLLAEQGYDVWLINNRGNSYSRKHGYISNQNYVYWLFGLDEMIHIDFEFNIEHIKKITGKNKLIYVGHSEGISHFYGKLMEQPEFANNFKSMFSLGGFLIPDIKKLDTTTQKLLNSGLFEKFYKLETYEAHFVPENRFPLLGLLCDVLSDKCWNYIDKFCGVTKQKHYNKDEISIIAGRKTGGTSIMHLAHWIQILKNKKFKKFDFGEERNIKKYNSKSSPEYNLMNLKKINIPKYFYIGDKDSLAENKGNKDGLIENLEQESVFITNVEDYGHFDYVIGNNAKEIIYNDLINKL